MKKISILLVFVAAIFFTFSSCKKDNFVKTNGILTGEIKDASTFGKLGNVVVTVEGTQLTDTTNADGTYKISGISAGEYRIIYKKTGFATQKQVVTIVSSGATSKEDDNEDYQVVNDEQLLPLTGAVNGSVLDQNGAPVNNAIVKASVIYKNSFLDTLFVATTNTVGYYSFSNLPFAPTASVVLLASGVNSSGTDVAHYSAASFTIQSVNISVNESEIQFASANFTNGNGNNNFDPSAQILLTFTANIDLQSTQQYGNITLTNLTTGNAVGINVIIPPTGVSVTNTLLISPLAKLASFTSYKITGSVYSSPTQKIDLSLLNNQLMTFKTKPVTINPMSLITVPEYTVGTVVTLTKATPGAIGYDIYAQISSISEFVQVASTYPLAVAVVGPPAVAAVTFATPTGVTYPAGTKFYIVPVGLDANGKTIRGLASAVLAK